MNRPRRHPRRLAVAALGALLLAGAQSAAPYPLDAYEITGIGRLEAGRRIENDQVAARKQPRGALLTRAQVDLRLLGHADFELPAADPEFTRQLVEIFGAYADRYSVAVLDLTDPDHPRYAEHAGTVARNPGSVGKLLVVLALFQALADLYPDDFDQRWSVLRDTPIVADEFVLSDSHTVWRWDREREQSIRRPLAVGDRGSLFEFTDWMLSASSNSAAAAVLEHTMLLRAFGAAYPVGDARGRDYFRSTPKTELGKALEATIQVPVTRNGLDLNTLRQGSFFTATGKRKVPGTSSHATARALMQYMLRLEQGRLVDEFSSREIKRLLYVTERRIRYASSPALLNAAVYFKSGSLFQCQPEEGFVCRPYQGNIRNFMNSVAIVEAPADQRRLHYIVTLMSNVLRRNSAVDHQTFATRIHQLIQSRHPAPETPAKP